MKEEVTCRLLGLELGMVSESEMWVTEGDWSPPDPCVSSRDVCNFSETFYHSYTLSASFFCQLRWETKDVCLVSIGWIFTDIQKGLFP